jgi:hypothetical protein
LNWLKLVFNRFELALASRANQVAEPVPRATEAGERATMTLLGIFTNGVSDERVQQAVAIVNQKLSVQEKLSQIDALLPFPPTASAADLAAALGVSKQAVMKTSWWKQNRKGGKNEEAHRRREVHRQRAPSGEPSDSREG